MLDFMFKQNFLMVKSAKCIQPHPVHIITVGVMHTSLSVCAFSDYTDVLDVLYYTDVLMVVQVPAVVTTSCYHATTLCFNLGYIHRIARSG